MNRERRTCATRWPLQTRLAFANVHPQPLEKGTFSAALKLRDDGAASGSLLLRTDTGQERYLLVQGQVLCDAGEPVGIELRGTALVLGRGSGSATADFAATVRPDAEIEECLIFELTGSGVSPPRRVEAEGELRFADGSCAPSR